MDAEQPDPGGERERRSAVGGVSFGDLRRKPAADCSSAHDVQYHGEGEEAVEYAPWLSGNGETIARFFGKTPSYAKSSPEPLSALIPNNPGDLDLMWAAFFASGNILYLGKIVDVLDDGVPLTRNKTRDLATRAAAKW